MILGFLQLLFVAVGLCPAAPPAAGALAPIEPEAIESRAVPPFSTRAPVLPGSPLETAQGPEP